jgi:hypothetical protein
MDIAFDRDGWTARPGDGRADASGRPDWPGLRARLWAARAAHHALRNKARAGTGAIQAAVQAGSFDRSSARMLADYGPGLIEVNPDSWANGKPVGARDSCVADETSLGERGKI